MWRVSFSDDAGNDESLTSTSTATVAAALTAVIRDAPEIHNGTGDFTFEMRFSEEPHSDFSYLTLQMMPSRLPVEE